MTIRRSARRLMISRICLLELIFIVPMFTWRIVIFQKRGRIGKRFWKIIPDDANIPKVLFGMGRSFMWERNYDSAVVYFDRLFRDFTNTPDGRTGFNFKASSYVRWGKSAEAAEAYKQYAVMFPYGEKIDSAYLNIIDALREIGKYDEANEWVDKTVERFKGMPVEVNAFHAKLRMEIRRENWSSAIETADRLIGDRRFFRFYGLD